MGSFGGVPLVLFLEGFLRGCSVVTISWGAFIEVVVMGLPRLLGLASSL